jgi:hypothetical protein
LSDEPASGGDEPPPPREPAWTRLIAPLRSEDAAFRMVVWAACAALVLAAVVLLVRLVS